MICFNIMSESQTPVLPTRKSITMQKSKAKQAAMSGETIIITVEELERRKDRFRKATKEYYEQAEKGFRLLHGFCGPNEDVASRLSSAFHLIQDENEPPRRKRKRSEASLSPLKRTKSLKRCRRRRFHRPQVPELEADLAERLLESHFQVVDLALQDYLFAIRHLVRPAPSFFWPQDQEEQSQTSPARHGVVLRLPSVALPLPLPIALDTSGECLPNRLERHRSEATEEEHLAMASVLRTSREAKITQDLAQKIYDGVHSIQENLSKISSLIEANQNNTYFCCHYDCFRSDSEETIFKPSAILHHKKGNGVAWDRQVVDALKLDGYYRWFRENNGILLDQTKDDEQRDERESSSGACSCQEFLVMGEGGKQETVLMSNKRLRRVSVDEQQERQRVCPHITAVP